ncbi:MAG: methyltransferase [Ferruginibacter sp.]
MPNNYFSFKQFTIHQDQCAMKVCTDACVLGAWAAGKFEKNIHTKNVLDIGTGTGLLSLMLAQKINAAIDAIEIDRAAAKQAKENVLLSPWQDKIDIINVSLQQFDTTKKYDLIISNPPFFEDDLKSPDDDKNAAKHDSTLKLDELVVFIKNKLNENASAVVLIPFQRTNYFAELLKEHHLYINETLFVKQSPKHDYFRSVILFSNENIQPIESNELIIHDDKRNYTYTFKILLAPYYLKL